MKKNLIITLAVVGMVAFAGVTAYAGKALTKDITCPNCGTTIEMPERFGGRDRGMVAPRKTIDELKEELAEKVASGEMTQEQMDKAVSEYELRLSEMKEKSGERKGPWERPGKRPEKRTEKGENPEITSD